MFTSAPNFSVTTIVPTYSVAGTSEPVCNALTQYGSGHYDAVIQVTDTPSDLDSPEQEDEPHCTCGQKETNKSYIGICFHRAHVLNKVPMPQGISPMHSLVQMQKLP